MRGVRMLWTEKQCFGMVSIGAAMRVGEGLGLCSCKGARCARNVQVMHSRPPQQTMRSLLATCCWSVSCALSSQCFGGDA